MYTYLCIVRPSLFLFNILFFRTELSRRYNSGRLAYLLSLIRCLMITRCTALESPMYRNDENNNKKKDIVQTDLNKRLHTYTYTRTLALPLYKPAICISP